MILNILYIYLDNQNNNKFFNKILIIGFIIYNLIYFFLGGYTSLICIFDSIYLLQKYIYKPTIIQNINHKLIKNIKKNIDKMDNKIDPEFVKDDYKPYIYNIKDTITQISNNLLSTNYKDS